MNDTTKKLVIDGITRLSEHLSNSGCNDLWVPNNPEMREIWADYNYYNLGATEPSDPEWIPYPESEEPTVVVNDGVIVFLLKKELGLLE